MRKLITLFLLVFALALGASVMAQTELIQDDPGRIELINSGQVALEDLAISGAVSEVATIDDAVSVAEPFPEDDGPLPATPQEGEPAEASIYIGVMLLAIIGLLLTGLRRLNFTAKRQARTLLFQPPQTT